MCIGVALVGLPLLSLGVVVLPPDTPNTHVHTQLKGGDCAFIGMEGCDGRGEEEKEEEGD